jgi:carboxylesterase
MDRERIANLLLKPPDFLLGTALAGLRRTGKLEVASEKIYELAQSALRLQFEKMNSLKVEGVENIPTCGGLILASNHQSWLDVQVLVAASPRRITFIAKSEFEHWPVLRHLIALSQSVFIRRGGDDEGLRAVVAELQSGKVVAIYPEGTIPGEENIPRHAVDPRTGLLRGHTGAVRLSLSAGVPIVPVGVSGTGRALPPEVYPRLELLRLPSNAPITIRFGRPIQPTLPADGQVTGTLLRELTDQLMMEISALVDHHQNYVPIEVPIPRLPKHDHLGVLLLHGFTSSVDAVDRLQPYLASEKIEVERPVLRGHGTRYQDLSGVTARDWYQDAEAAFLRLASRVDRVIVVGFSMGGLLALELGMSYPERIAGLVTLGAALRFRDRLAGLSPVLSRMIPYWPSPNSFCDPECAKKNTNYPKFATDAFASLYEYSKEIERRLPEVNVPIRVIHSKKDQVIDPISANLIYEGVSSAHREIVWFERSGHEMLMDLEADDVCRSVLEFVRQFKAPAWAETPRSPVVGTAA